MQQGQPMIIMGEDAQRVKDQDAQEYNISAARAVAESVRSTLGPKGMDKMLVDSMGTVTITNDGVTILQEMDIDNPTAEMIVEVAETQEDEAGDGTTTAVAIAGELLKNAEDLLDQDIHPTAIIKGFNMASEKAREEIDEIAERVDPSDEDLIRKVAET
jgi:chaperonin GroEL (HSP60 family)